MTFTLRLGPLPVRAHGWLPLLAVALGLGARGGLLAVAARAAAFVVAVLAHELAHGVAALAFHAPAEVGPTSLGGRLGGKTGAAQTAARRVIVYLAGPAASLGVGAATFAAMRVLALPETTGAGVLESLGWISLGWGLVNLLPILPLDAGNALVAALDRPTRGRGEVVVRFISIAPSLALAFAAFVARMPLPAAVCAVVALANGRGLAVSFERSKREARARAHVRAAYDCLERGRAAAAVTHCRAAMSDTTDPVVLQDAVRLLAYAYATNDRWDDLLELLESGGAGSFERRELERYEHAASELGRLDEARRIRMLCGEAA